MLLLIGNKGNMGSRYTSILKHLREQFDTHDIGDDGLERKVLAAKKVIIATTTATHFSVLKQIHDIRTGTATPIADVLCEKPVTKDILEVAKLRVMQSTGRFNIYSVNQYAYLPQAAIFNNPNNMGGARTHYNYFKHGSDGLPWDCFPLFVLSRGLVTLNNMSPIWNCRINGAQLRLGDLDKAYIDMVQDFIGPKRKVWDIGVIEYGTRKVLKWIADEEADIIESLNRG